MEEPKKKIEIAYYLIQRMSRTEKRYFKLYNQIYKGKNKDFIKLFDFLNSLKEYDILNVEAFLNENIKQKNLSIAYLLDKIIETMYSTGKDELRTVRNLVQPHLSAFYVYRKAQLFELAYKELNKAEQIAAKYEQYTILFEVYELKRYTLENTQYNEEICEPEDIILEKRSDTLRKITHQGAILSLASAIYNANAQTANKIEESHEELLSYRKHYDEFGVLEKISFNLCCSLYYRSKKARRKAITFITDALKLWEDNPHLIPHQLDSYGSSWGAILVLGTYPDSIDIALEYYEMYKKLPQKHKEVFSNLPTNNEIKYYIYLYLFEIAYAILSEKYNQIASITRNIKSMIERYANSMIKEDLFYSVLLRVAYGNTLIKNYTESEYWLDQLAKAIPINALLKDEMELLKLILMHESNNESLLKSNIRSLQRRWDITPTASPCVLPVLELLRASLLKNKKKKLTELFDTTHKQLVQLENNVLFCLPFSKWVALKIQA